jgi:equilibrative nucleoside transporter 1/2/3
MSKRKDNESVDLL